MKKNEMEIYDHGILLCRSGFFFQTFEQKGNLGNCQVQTITVVKYRKNEHKEERRALNRSLRNHHPFFHLQDTDALRCKTYQLSSLEQSCTSASFVDTIFKHEQITKAKLEGFECMGCENCVLDGCCHLVLTLLVAQLATPSIRSLL